MNYRKQMNIKTKQSSKERLSIVPYVWVFGVALALLVLHASFLSPKAIKCHTITGARYAIFGGCYKESYTMTRINLDKKP